MHDHLGVRLRPEAVPASFQLGAELAVVVDLAVEDELDGAVLVPDRLVPRLEVDDRQAPEPEADAGSVVVLFDVDPVVVRPSMPDRRRHAAEDVTVYPLAADDAADPAHPVVSRYPSGAGSSTFSRSRTM